MFGLIFRTYLGGKGGACIGGGGAWIGGMFGGGGILGKAMGGFGM